MNAVIHWHVHDDGAICIYQSGKLLLRLELPAHDLAGFAQALLLAAIKRKD